MALKIIFMGTPDFAVPILKSIYKSNNKILEVYTQPPKKKNRGQKILSSPVHKCADELNLKTRFPNSLETNEELDHFKSLNPDLVLVVAYGKILPKKLLNLDKILFINLHASLLPRWRGAAPIQRAIMSMDKETGISVMKIVENFAYFSGENHKHCTPVKHIMDCSCSKCLLKFILVTNLCHGNQCISHRGPNVSTHNHRNGNMNVHTCANGSHNN